MWCQIGRELEDVGITSAMFQDNRAFIIGWIKDASDSGQFEERCSRPEQELRSILLPRSLQDGQTQGEAWFAVEEQARKSVFLLREDQHKRSNGEMSLTPCECYTGLFIPGYGLSLRHVQECLGPRSSTQPYTHRGHEGTMILHTGYLTQVCPAFSYSHLVSHFFQ